MAVIGFPLDAVDSAPSYTGRMLRETLSVLVGGGTSARPLAGASGVNPRTPTNTVTATATTWSVKAHGGYIDAQTDGEAAGYLYAVNSSGGLPTGAMAAANATNPRIDLISVQVNDPAEGDGSTVPTVGIVYTTGNPSASPAIPVAPARSLVLARIAVPKFGAGSPAVTWVAPYMSAAQATQYAVFRSTAGGATSGVNYPNAGPLALDAAASVNSPASMSGVNLHINTPGLYAITRTFQKTSAGGVTGRSYIDVIAQGIQLRSNLEVGEDKGSVTFAAVRFPAAGEVSFNTYMLSSGTYSWASQVVVARIGDA